MIVLKSNTAVANYLKDKKDNVTGPEIKTATWNHFAKRATKEHEVHLCSARIGVLEKRISDVVNIKTTRALDIDTHEGFTALVGFAKSFFDENPTCNH